MTELEVIVDVEQEEVRDHHGVGLDKTALKVVWRSEKKIQSVELLSWRVCAHQEF